MKKKQGLINTVLPYPAKKNKRIHHLFLQLQLIQKDPNNRVLKKQQRAGAEQLVVESANVEIIAKPGLCRLSQRQDF